jgi:hypothetical protein
MRRFVIALLVAGASTLVVASTTAAVPTTDTTITIGGSQTLSSANPCSGVAGTATISFNSVFHITDLGQSPETGLEIFNIAATTTGTFLFVPSDPSEPTYTGHFVSSFQVQSTTPGFQFNQTSEFIAVAAGSDGSRLVFVEITHFTSTPAGVIAVNFDRPTCASG